MPRNVALHMGSASCGAHASEELRVRCRGRNDVSVTEKETCFLRSLDLLKGQRFPERISLSVNNISTLSNYNQPLSLLISLLLRIAIPRSKRYLRQNEALRPCPDSRCRRRFRCASREHEAGKGAIMPGRPL